MKSVWALPVLLAASLFARAEEQDLVSTGTRDLTMQAGDEDRTYRLHVGEKKEKDKAAPLVIVLHGLGGTGAITERMTGFSELADRKGFVVAYPDGLNRMWRMREAGGGKKDREFIAAMMEALVKAGTVDPRRIYVTGISNGAYFSNVLAAEMGDRIAAAAPVSGTFIKAISADVKPVRAMPICYFHGTDDSVVGYDGADMFSKRESSMGAEELVAWWAEKNGCEKEPKIEKLEDKAPEDGTTVEKWTYAGTAPVVFFRIKGGGHSWPGSTARLKSARNKSTQDISATKEIWAFFERHTLPCVEEPK